MVNSLFSLLGILYTGECCFTELHEKTTISHYFTMPAPDISQFLKPFGEKLSNDRMKTESSPNLDWISDLPAGPLDKFRASATFNWKRLKILLEGDEEIKLKVLMIESGVIAFLIVNLQILIGLINN